MEKRRLNIHFKSGYNNINGGDIMKKVVVENTLKPYIDHLERNGYDVYTLYKNENINNITSTDYEAIVISGMDDLSLNEVSHSNPPVPIIDASGKSPDDILNILNQR